MASKPPAFDDIGSRLTVDQDDGDPVLAVTEEPTVVSADDGPAPADGVDDPGGPPGEEQSAAEDSTPREEHEVGLKPDGDNPAEDFRLSATDLTGTDEEQPPEIFLGKDRPTEDELAARLIGGGGDGGAAESAAAGRGADGGGSGDTGEGGASGVVTREDVAAAGRGSSGEAPTDPGPPPPDSGDGAPYGGLEGMLAKGAADGARTIANAAGDLPVIGPGLDAAKDNTTDPAGAGNPTGDQMRAALKEQDTLSADPPVGPNDVVSEHESADGSVYVVKFGDGTTIVSNATNNTTTTLLPDGSSDTVDHTTGKTTHTDPPAQPDPDEEGAEIPAELRAQLDADLVALRQHTGGQNDAGTEIQPAEGDAAFGAGAPTVALSPTFSSDRAVEMLGQPGDAGLDFGGGGNTVDPNSGTTDPGEQADTTPVTDGRELDPFDRQQDSLERPADDAGADDAGTEDADTDDGAGGDASGVLVPHADLRRVDETDDLPDAVDPG